MNEALAGVLMMAIFIGGIVGGVIILTVIQKVVPLLKELVRQRDQTPSHSELQALTEAVHALSHRVAELQESSLRAAEAGEQARLQSQESRRG